MGQLVCGQVSHLPKGLATPWVVTHIRSLAGVNSLVRGQAATLVEACVAASKVAFKGPLSCVNALVRGQVSIMGEACVATREVAKVFSFLNGSLHQVWGWGSRR